MKDKERCFFLTAGGYNFCSLTVEQCSDRPGHRCSFRKTEQEYIEAQRHAIELNRRKGNCARCKYKRQPCEITKKEAEEYDG